MEISNVYLKSVGTYLPPAVSIQHAIEQGWYDEKDRKLHGLKGALVAGDMSPAEMALEAARSALQRAGSPPSSDLDLLIHAGVFPQGPDGWSLPGYVLRELGGGSAPVLEIRNGCIGMLTALEIAIGQQGAPFFRSDVLLTAAENFSSPIFDRWRSGYSFIAGDGASAMLLSATAGFARVCSINSLTIPELEAAHRGSQPLFPPNSITGAPIDLKARADEFAATFMPTIDTSRLMIEGQLDLITRSLKDAHIEVSDVARVIPTNAVWHVVKTFTMDPLGLPMDQSTWRFGSARGHLGASDFAVAVEHLLTTGEVGPGDHVVLVGGAAGYSMSCAVLQILERPGWATDAA